MSRSSSWKRPLGRLAGRGEQDSGTPSLADASLQLVDGEGLLVSPHPHPRPTQEVQALKSRSGGSAVSPPPPRQERLGFAGQVAAVGLWMANPCHTQRVLCTHVKKKEKLEKAGRVCQRPFTDGHATTRGTSF